MRIFENIAGVARPVRIVANSSLANSTARSIFSSASKSASSITFSTPIRGIRLLSGRSFDWRRSVRLLGGDQGADLLAGDRADDGVRALGAEDEHGQLVVQGQAQRGGVDDPQALAQRLLEG